MASNPPERPEDLTRVLAEETSRGTRRKLPDEEALQERKERRQDMWDLLRIGDRKSFIAALTSPRYGLQAGSKEYKLALKVWDEHHGQRR